MNYPRHLLSITFIFISTFCLSGCYSSKGRISNYSYYPVENPKYKSSASPAQIQYNLQTEHFKGTVIDFMDQVDYEGDCTWKGLVENDILTPMRYTLIRQDKDYDVYRFFREYGESSHILVVNRNECTILVSSFDMDSVLGIGKNRSPSIRFDDISPDFQYTIVRVWDPPYQIPRIPILMRKDMYLLDLKT